MKSRGFRGLPADFVVDLAAASARRDVFLCVAEAKRQTVAAALFLRHGPTATYVAAAAEPEGRAVHAGTLLAWRGLQALQEAGATRADLGQADTGRSAGLARFKLGMGGEVFVRRDADEASLLRLSKQLTVFWGIVQLGVALGAQFLDRSLLDSGLSVLSLTAGPILGAFLIGVLTSRVGAGAMLTGMAAGSAVLGWVWWTGAMGFTWFALVGALVTAAVALLGSVVTPKPAS